MFVDKQIYGQHHNKIMTNKMHTNDRQIVLYNSSETPNCPTHISIKMKEYNEANLLHVMI